MSKDRKVYAPFSLTSELGGVTQTPVEGYIDVEQRVKPVLTVGNVDEKGVWSGFKSSDRQFIAFTRDEAIPDNAEILTPTVNPDGTWPLDMTGFNDLFLAIKPSRGGNIAATAVMGPDTLRFANLEPVDPAATLVGVDNVTGNNSFYTLFTDNSQALTADVWNIFYIAGMLRNQKLLQFKITNQSGGNSNIECAFMRVV
jgi:hypothetical protein